MMNSKSIFVSLMLILFLGGLSIRVYPGNAREDGPVSVTHHSIKINGKILKYRAAAGYMSMKDKKTKPLASIFFIAYTREDTRKDPARPITFAFNGGPGGSATWIHMGGTGPKIARTSDEGFPLPPPYRYVDNENTWLEFTDLVFVDPVSTGYSRMAEGVDRKKFHGITEDIQTVGDFIRLYVTKYRRWSSPMFICGCSYAVQRSIGLAGYLQDRYYMFPRGLILLVGFLNRRASEFEPGLDLPYALQLPSYTAYAWYHKKLPEKYQKNLAATLEEVEQWALSGYLPALVKGDTLPRNQRDTIINKLSQYTGLDKNYIESTNLRILSFEFIKELLRDKKQTIGLYDCRYTIDNSNFPNFFIYDPLSDPSLTSCGGTFGAVINHYIRTELKYANDLPYELLNLKVYPWNWGSAKEGRENMTETLRSAIKKNKYLKVMFVNGYYDIRVPYFSNDYAINHLHLPASLRKNIVFKCYPSGHKLYVHKPVFKKLRSDVQNFYMNFLE
jgi:carboxypeptidase C (cathepsin A)